jgi:hypothetical protein
MDKTLSAANHAKMAEVHRQTARDLVAPRDDRPAEGADDRPAEGADDRPAEGADDRPAEGALDPLFRYTVANHHVLLAIYHQLGAMSGGGQPIPEAQNDRLGAE